MQPGKHVTPHDLITFLDQKLGQNAALKVLNDLRARGGNELAFGAHNLVDPGISRPDHKHPDRSTAEPDHHGWPAQALVELRGKIGGTDSHDYALCPARR